MINQQAIFNELQSAWEQKDFNNKQKTDVYSTKFRFPSTGRSFVDFSHFQGWNQQHIKKDFRKQKQQIKRMSFNLSPKKNKNKTHIVTSLTKRQKYKEQKNIASIIMMGCPLSETYIKSKYYISNKDKTNFRIQQVNNQKKRVGRLYVKSCDDKIQKQKFSKQKDIINPIKVRNRGTKIKFKPKNISYYKNKKVQVLRIT